MTSELNGWIGEHTGENDIDNLHINRQAVFTVCMSIMWDGSSRKAPQKDIRFVRNPCVLLIY